MAHVKIWTDGACSGNPGPTGWAYKLEVWESDSSMPFAEKTGAGYIQFGTNNIGELTAVIEALKALKVFGTTVTVYSDSKYVINGITSWIHDWKKRGWKNSKKKPVLNKDLWVQLDLLASQHDITWKWVKAHNGDPNNELVDQLAVKQYADRM